MRLYGRDLWQWNRRIIINSALNNLDSAELMSLVRARHKRGSIIK
ncbi:hypothetical protein BN938_1639 [Mucinivorans hirudinis]|uniref:Uncharacterized protein n=1 Tax=Mucinivorans hirudinis TaxID=1433126 RepID=A0A060RDD8_9BACT|nr:hypothetical protein BN938_1639 [Mucinivorans hirudinis]